MTPSPPSLQRQTEDDDGKAYDGRLLNRFAHEVLDEQQRQKGAEKDEVGYSRCVAGALQGAEPKDKGESHLKKPNVDPTQQARPGCGWAASGEKADEGDRWQSEEEVEKQPLNGVDAVTSDADPVQGPDHSAAESENHTDWVVKAQTEHFTPGGDNDNAGITN